MTTEITIRWRRHGRGGTWRADLPPGNGIDSGFVESSSLETVEYVAGIVADRYGYQISRDLPDAAQVRMDDIAIDRTFGLGALDGG